MMTGHEPRFVVFPREGTQPDVVLWTQCWSPTYKTGPHDHPEASPQRTQHTHFGEPPYRGSPRTAKTGKTEGSALKFFDDSASPLKGPSKKLGVSKARRLLQ